MTSQCAARIHGRRLNARWLRAEEMASQARRPAGRRRSLATGRPTLRRRATARQARPKTVTPMMVATSTTTAQAA